MTNNLLTPDRIEAAREFYQRLADSEEAFTLSVSDEISTCIAALDLAEWMRWRSIYWKSWQK